MRKIILLLGLIGLGFSTHARAGVFELGGSYAYQKSTYNAGSYTWSQRWSGSLGYYFSQDSELELMYQDSLNKNYQLGVQDITYHDRVYSMNLLYYLMGQEAAIKPYFRIGGGQLNRDETGTYVGSNFSPPGRLDEITVILGFGLKAKVNSRISIKLDATSYLSGGAVSSWKDNLAISIGGSFYF